jgi:hypothetical protein
MSQPTDLPPIPSPLQFDRAEVPEAAASGNGGSQCAFCQTPLTSSYYDINGQMACDWCRSKVEKELRVGPGISGFLKACAAGFGAAVVGAGIYYAVLALSGYEVGLISILVGFLVGRAVRWGARGRGGWRYQSLAVFLTYMAIVSTYIPLMFKEMAEEPDPGQQVAAMAPAAVGATVEGPAAVASPAAEPAGAPGTEPELTVGEVVLGTLGIFALAAALPFLAGFENILGILIIGFGLWEAWRINKRTELAIIGPLTFGVTGATSAAPPAPATPA